MLPNSASLDEMASKGVRNWEGVSLREPNTRGQQQFTTYKCHVFEAVCRAKNNGLPRVLARCNENNAACLINSLPKKSDFFVKASTKQAYEVLKSMRQEYPYS
jgi:hypothetical protein